MNIKYNVCVFSSLHRSSSFNSSGRGSQVDEDRWGVGSDNSLEDDVMDLSQKVNKQYFLPRCPRILDVLN